jgi:hypothetical protein
LNPATDKERKKERERERERERVGERERERERNKSLDSERTKWQVCFPSFNLVIPLPSKWSQLLTVLLFSKCF